MHKDDEHKTSFFRDKWPRASYNPNKSPRISLPIPGFITADSISPQSTLLNTETWKMCGAISPGDSNGACGHQRSPSPVSPLPTHFGLSSNHDISLITAPVAASPSRNYCSLFSYLPNHVSKRFSKRAQSDPWIAEKFHRYSFNRRYTLGTDTYFLAEVITLFFFNLQLLILEYTKLPSRMC